MSEDDRAVGLQLQSRLDADGTLEISLVEVPTPRPAAEEVLVRVEAAPLNPSDLGLLLAGLEPDALTAEGSAERPTLRGKLTPEVFRAFASRAGQSLPVGNEGAGTVVAAGSSSAAQALLGKTVSIAGGATYAEYRLSAVEQVLPLPAGTSAEEGASWFVNPMTVLGFVETARSEGHRGIVHTAAASNLGQMLHKVCAQDGIPLVNIVRKPEQAALLRELGARYVVDSSAPSFMADLIEAVAATSATIAFDAVGGGKLAGQILTAMEVVASRSLSGYHRYGSAVDKRVYIYGMLDVGPTLLQRNFGFAWNLGGWLLPNFLQRAGADTQARLRARVARELTTTFRSHYARRISLPEALELANVRAYAQKSTGAKYLITPHVRSQR